MCSIDLGLAGTANSFSSERPAAPIRLPDDCGRRELAQLLAVRLATPRSQPSRQALARLLAVNHTAASLAATQRSAFASSGTARDDWVRLCTAGVLGDLSSDELTQLIFSDQPDHQTAKSRASLLHTFHGKRVENIAEAYPLLIESALDGQGPGLSLTEPSPASRLAQAGSVMLALQRVEGHAMPLMSGDLPESSPRQREDDPKLLQFLSATDTTVVEPRTWSTDLRPWNQLVANLSSAFGPTWATYALSVVASGIRSREQRGAHAKQLFSEETPLCDRARYARLRRGGAEWWIAELSTTKTPHERMFWLLLLLRWAKDEVVQACTPQVEEALAELSEGNFCLLFETLQLMVASLRTRRAKESLIELPPQASNRLLGLYLFRLPTRSSRRHIDSLLQSGVPCLLRLAHLTNLEVVLQAQGSSPAQAEKVRAAIAFFYSEYGALPAISAGRVRDALRPVAAKIASSPLDYPYEILVACEAAVRPGGRASPVAEQAAAAGWSFE